MIRVFVRPCAKTYKEQHTAAYELLDAALNVCGYKAGKILKTENGKPYFENSETFFSISHTDGYACVAVGDSPCGVDIEKNSVISQRVRNRYLGGCDEKDALRLWTERESYGKLMGDGFFTKEKADVFFKSFSFSGNILTVCACKEDELPAFVEFI